MNHNIFKTIPLDDKHNIYLATKVPEFNLSYTTFEALWNIHPAEFHTLKIHGKEVKTPRWQQAYGKNYRYTGAKNNALPITEDLQPYLDWSKQHVNECLNGLLLNWYDGKQDHYIGAHRDDTRDLINGSPIVTISLGQERIFRMRKWKQKGYKDITVRMGDVIVVPWETNLIWTHEVPKFKRYNGKRISVTLRGYV